MSEKKSRPPKRADSASPLNIDDLQKQRDAFVHTFFKKGAEFTEELLKENERLRGQLRKVEQENASLRTQLASDEAIRDALRKIEQLEREKQDLLSQFSAAEAVTTRFTNRYAEIEEELSNLANLYVASYQLHSTMKLPAVMKHLRELLAQLVGARAHAIYVADEKHRQLVPIASDGVDVDRLPRVQIIEGATDESGGASGTIERVFLTGIPQINEGPLVDAGTDAPAACVPMRIEDRAVGVIVIYEVLPQKERFVSVDFELFKMLAAHAATALAGAMLYTHDDGKLPGLDVFRELEPSRNL
jgi:GAF domain-containing protein